MWSGQSLSHTWDSAARGLWPTRLLSLWNFPGQNTGPGCRFLLQGIFPTQGLHPHLLYHLPWPLVPLGKPIYYIFTNYLCKHSKVYWYYTPIFYNLNSLSTVLKNLIIMLIPIYTDQVIQSKWYMKTLCISLAIGSFRHIS